MTTAMIIGFITGSLGVVWPWKRTIFLADINGEAVLDSNGDQIIVNYQRYLPTLSDPETWWSILFILLGIATLIGLERYGQNRKETA